MNRLADSLHAAFSMTGLSKGGTQIQECKKSFKKAVELLVDLASLQTSFLTLDEVIKATNRRVNAIEYVIIPKVQVRGGPQMACRH